MNHSLLEKFIRTRKIVQLDSYKDFYVDCKSDSLLTSAELASAIDILYRGHWVYYYTGKDIKLFFGFLFPYGDDKETFRDMVNAWISVCYRNGIYQERYDYWIMGNTNIVVDKPWSVLDWLESKNYFLKTKEPQPQLIQLIEH